MKKVLKAYGLGFLTGLTAYIVFSCLKIDRYDLGAVTAISLRIGYDIIMFKN